MAANTPDPAGAADESEVWNAISAFEQILEAMPNDRTSLETLAHAYEQIGDLTQAKDYTVRLAGVVLDEADQAAAAELSGKLKPYAADDPEVASLIERLDGLGGGAAAQADDAAPADGAEEGAEPSEGATPAAPAAAPPPTVNVPSSFNIADELPFAWNLLQANEITQEEYSSIVQDLTDMSGTDASVTVSVLHVLTDRSFKNIGRVMTTVSKDCNAPIVSLSSFDIQQEAFTLLPRDFMLMRGTVIFELFGDDALAVVMNPYDKQLLKDVESACGRKCFFYMTPPEEFDEAMAKIGEQLDGLAAEAAGA